MLGVAVRAATLTTEGWHSNSPINMADPMPEEVCYAMVSIVFAASRKVVAIMILLCFGGLLRVQDVLTPEQHQFGH